MNRNNGSAGIGGIGLPGILFIVFLILKLVGVIDWSWWWVCAPLWIGIPLGIVLFIIYVLILYNIDRKF